MFYSNMSPPLKPHEHVKLRPMCQQCRACNTCVELGDLNEIGQLGQRSARKREPTQKGASVQTAQNMG